MCAGNHSILQPGRYCVGHQVHQTDGWRVQVRENWSQLVPDNLLFIWPRTFRLYCALHVPLTLWLRLIDFKLLRAEVSLSIEMKNWVQSPLMDFFMSYMVEWEPFQLVDYIFCNHLRSIISGRVKSSLCKNGKWNFWLSTNNYKIYLILS
jgi:hypothetical protein